MTDDDRTIADRRKRWCWDVSETRLSDYADGSAAVGAVRRSVAVGGEIWRPIAEGLGRASRHSWLGRVGRGVGIGVAHSRLVRWLTEEPEPAVVTIDLAETRTVGPVLSATEWLATVLETPYRFSHTHTVGATLSRTTATDAIRVISGIVLGVVLASVALGRVPTTVPGIVALAAVTVGALLGVLLENPRVPFAESRIVTATGRALRPPPTEERAE